LAVVVTVAKGYDLAYIWKTQAEPGVRRTTGGYYLNAAQAGEPPGRWWGPGAQALSFTPGQIVRRAPYEAVYQRIDPRTGSQLGRSRGRYATFAEHLARLTAAEPHATAERLIELERLPAQATRQPAAYTDVARRADRHVLAAAHEPGRRPAGPYPQPDRPNHPHRP
jgi:TrwC relaxase